MIKCCSSSISDKKISFALLLLRIVAGLAFMFHGYSKIQAPFTWMGAEAPVPGIFQALAALAEFGGGLAWIIGLMTRLASFGILCTMAVAANFHISKGDPFVGAAGSYELALVYFCIAALLMVGGAGVYALDNFICKKRCEG